MAMDDTVKVERAELYRRLMLDMWPELFEGRMNKFVIGEPEGEDGKKTVAFRDDESGLRGCVMQDYSVRVMALSGEVVYLGSLNGDNVMVNNLARISNTLDPDAEYMYMRSLKMDGATLQRINSREDDPVVHMNSPFTKDQTMCVRAKGKKTLNVTAKLANQVFMDLASKSQQCAERKHGLTLFQVNHFNPCVSNVTNDTHGMRADSELSKAWVTFLKNSDNQAEVGKYRIVYTGHSFYLFNSVSGTWYKNKNMDVMVNKMTEAMESVSRGAFMESLNEGEKNYVRGIRGGTHVFRRMLNDILEPQFEKNLDANMDLLPFDNGVYHLRTGVFRPLKWDDYVTTTIGYQYEAEPSPERVSVSRSFFDQVLPFPEEREMLLRMAGSALCGMPINKKFVVMQDYRGGDNGKSMVIKAFEAAFGAFCMPNQPAFLCASAHTNPNGHEANTLAYKGKRLAIFDETDPKARFDITKLKSLTGGAPRMAVRGAGAATVTEFRWSAFIMIACNKNCLPQVDSTDAAFLERMIPIPMRTKFNDADFAACVPMSHTKDVDMQDKICDARMAVMHVLLEALSRHQADGGRVGTLPIGCMELRKAIVMDSDPLSEIVTKYVDDNVVFDWKSEGRNGLCFLERDKVVDCLKRGENAMCFKGVRTSTIKALVDEVMERKGSAICTKVKVEGKQYYNVYKGCGFKLAIEIGNGSKSELNFRKAIEELTGLNFPSVRPPWLLNVTGKAMELDMYNEANSIAVEYDGPHHFVFPNAYQTSVEEFEAQTARDRLKDRLCVVNGVTLIRVRASILAQEIEYFKTAYDATMKM